MSELERVNVDGDWVTREAEGGGSQPIEYVSKTLTSAQILDLHNTPVEILPAPGGRFYYVIHSVVLHFRPGDTPYVGDLDDNFVIFYGSVAGDIAAGQAIYWWGATLGPFPMSELLQQEEEAYVYGPRPRAGFNDISNSGDWQMWMASAIEDKALSVMAVGAFADGDGELTMRVFYSNIDGAPPA